MSYGIRIVGVREAQQLLGANFEPAMRAATLAIAKEIESELAPYPPATIANSPENPRGYWYERGYGPKWWVGRASDYLMARRAENIAKTGLGGANLTRRQLKAAERKGMIHGSPTSETMNRRWGIKRHGTWGAMLGNAASYAEYLHSAAKQARWAGPRGWITDKKAIEGVIREGTVKRIVVQAIVGALRKARR